MYADAFADTHFHALTYLITETDSNVAKYWNVKTIKETRGKMRQAIQRHFAGLEQRFPDSEDGSKDPKDFKRTRYAFERGRDVREGMPEWPRTINIYDPEQFAKYFGLRGLGFGEWEAKYTRKDGTTSEGKGSKKWQANKEAFLEYMWDGLHDIAYVIGIEPHRIGLGRWLTIDFGAQGRGGKNAATFWPSFMGQTHNNSINLTRPGGDGSFGHEWGHALDWYIGWHHGTYRLTKAFRPLLFYKFKTADLMRDIVNAAQDAWKEKPTLDLRETVDHVIEGYLSEEEYDFAGDPGHYPGNLAQDADNPAEWKHLYRHVLGTWSTQTWTTRHGRPKDRSNYVADIQGMNKIDYYRSPEEMFARAFESALQDLIGPDRRSEMVVGLNNREGVVSPENGYRATIYPAGDERVAFLKAFQNLFDTLYWKGIDGTGGGVWKWVKKKGKGQQLDVFKNAYHRAYLSDMLEFKKGIDRQKIVDYIQQGLLGHLDLYWYKAVGRRDKGGQPPGYQAFTSANEQWVDDGTQGGSRQPWRAYGFKEPLDSATIKKYNLEPTSVHEGQFPKPYATLYDWREAIKHGFLPEDSPDTVGDEPPNPSAIPPRTRRAGGSSRRGRAPDGDGDGDENQERGTPGGRTTDRDPDVSGSTDGDGDPDADAVSDPLRATRSDYAIPPEADELVQQYGIRSKTGDAGGVAHGALPKSLVDAVETLIAAGRRPEGERNLTTDEKLIVSRTEGVADLRGRVKDKDTLSLLAKVGYDSTDRKRLEKSAAWSRPVSLWVYRAMWSLAQQAGFHAGRVFVPNAGTGRIYGTMPPHLRKESVVFGHTPEMLDAELASAVYPKILTEYGDLADNTHANNFFDVALVVTTYENRAGYSLENIQALVYQAYRKLRPGGIAVVVTPQSEHNLEPLNRMEYAGHALLQADPLVDAGFDVPARMTLLRKPWNHAPPIKWPGGFPKDPTRLTDLPQNMRLFGIDRQPDNSEVIVPLDRYPRAEREGRVEAAVAEFHPEFISRDEAAPHRGEPPRKTARLDTGHRAMGVRHPPRQVGTAHRRQASAFRQGRTQ